MLCALLAVSLVTTAIPPSECLIAIEADYRTVQGQAWLEDLEVLAIGTDYLIARVDDRTRGLLPTHTVLDRGDLSRARYLKVELVSTAGRAAAGGLGTILFARDMELVVRQDGEIASDVRLDGIRAVLPLRRIALPALDSTPVPAPAFPDLVADMVAQVSTTSYQAAIQSLEDFTTRNARHANYRSACTHAHDVFESYGIPAEIEEYVADPWYGMPFTCWNVVAEKQGVVYPDSIFIICGHLDSTAGGPSTPENVAPGADDNGSGSAAVLEAARVMSPYDFSYTVRFICFGAEEQGLCGSDVYAQAAFAAGDRIRGVVNLDMLLYGPPGHDTIKVNYDGNSLPIAQAFNTAAATYVPGLNVRLVYAPGAGGSDHYSFWQVGYRAIEGIEDYLSGNPHYHRTSDLLANYAQYFPFGTNCARAGIATLASLADPQPSAGVPATPGVPRMEPLAITSLSPNPARDHVLVTLHAPGRQPVSLTVFDVLGRALRRTRVEPDATGTIGVELGLPDLPSGIYLLRAESGGGTATTAATKLAITR